MDKYTLQLLQMLAALTEAELETHYGITRASNTPLAIALFRWRDVMCPGTDSLAYDDEE